jgi:hypothetical protein
MDPDAMSTSLQDKRDSFCREEVDPAIVVMRVLLFHVKMVELRKPLIYPTSQTTKAQNIGCQMTFREDIFPQIPNAFRKVRGILVRVFYNFSTSSYCILSYTSEQGVKITTNNFQALKCVSSYRTLSAVCSYNLFKVFVKTWVLKSICKAVASTISSDSKES